MMGRKLCFLFSLFIFFSAFRLPSLVQAHSGNRLEGYQVKEHGNGEGHEHEHEPEHDGVIKRSMFPDDFLFGAAVSAYQIEGAYLEDGKGLNNWDVFTGIPGRINNGDNAYVADDHYHLYLEDIENLKNLGVNSYRLSISWARILPRGRFGPVNPRGVEFYNKVIDNLLLNGIEPFVTINHEDLPWELEKRYGSWLSSSIQEDFVLFAKICFEKFGDRVKYWATINEPNIFADMAYLLGTYPPGRCSPPFGNCTTGNSDVEPLTVVHNMLISHAKAVKLYRDQFQGKQKGEIGIVVTSHNYEPYRDDHFSRNAVERAFAFNLAWVLDPVIYGDYPPLMREYHGKELPEFTKEEKELVKGSVDFMGLNHYTTLYAIDCFHYADCIPSDNRTIRGFAGTTGYRDGIPIGEETGAPRFFVVPHGLEGLIDFVTARYPNVTIYVTENGYSPPGNTDLQQLLWDYKRVKFHLDYLSALYNATRKGCKVKGYFVWSLMDNFEWASGYETTFGLYYVDRKTLKRTPKLSAKWYSRFLADKEPCQNQTVSSSTTATTTTATTTTSTTTAATTTTSTTTTTTSIEIPLDKYSSSNLAHSDI